MCSTCLKDYCFKLFSPLNRPHTHTHTPNSRAQLKAVVENHPTVQELPPCSNYYLGWWLLSSRNPCRHTNLCRLSFHRPYDQGWQRKTLNIKFIYGGNSESSTRGRRSTVHQPWSPPLAEEHHHLACGLTFQVGLTLTQTLAPPRIPMQNASSVQGTLEKRFRVKK